MTAHVWFDRFFLCRIYDVESAGVLMAKRCMATGKGVLVGNNVSHANNKTKRRFLPNLQNFSLESAALKRTLRLRLSIHGMRIIEHRGGIDAFLKNTSLRKLTADLRPLKKKVEEQEAV